MDLFKTNQRISARIENCLVTILPTLKLGPLSSTLFSTDLCDLTSQVELLALGLKGLPL
jgi:hypothetical protein